MKAEYLKQIDDKVKEHAIQALFWLYKEASIGDNKLELKNPVPYSDGADYEIIALDWNYSKETGEVLSFFQLEEGTTYETEENVANLPKETLLDLLEAVEQTLNGYYETELYL